MNFSRIHSAFFVAVCIAFLLLASCQTAPSRHPEDGLSQSGSMPSEGAAGLPAESGAAESGTAESGPAESGPAVADQAAGGEPVLPESALPERKVPPLDIMGAGSMDADRLSAFLVSHNPGADPERAGRLASFYIEESSIEGVNADVAFVQMCLETGFLKFGGLVTEDMHNYCGLGSIGPGQPGLSFPDERTGVRAHVQHLKGYGSADPLVLELVDPRYKYVNPKGKAPTVHGLAGTWAADREYGNKLEGLLDRLFNGPAEVAVVSPL